MRVLALWTLMAALLVASARAAPVVDPPAPEQPGTPTVPSPPTPVFAANGLLIARPGDVDGARLAPLMRAHGFSWVALLVHDGGTSVNGAQLELGWARPFRELGIAVGGWGVLRSDPEADAELAAKLVRGYGLSFYLADAEFAYSNLGDPGRSRRFVAAFRARAPALPAILTSFGRVDGGYGFDWRAWRDAGFEFAPQCYLADGSAFAPPLAVAAALAVWPRSMIHPIIGLYGGATASDYGPGLADGYSIFPGETVDESVLAALDVSAG